jgi:hypothetical protein
MTALLITGLIVSAVISLAGTVRAFSRGANGSAVLSLLIPLYGAFYLLRTAKEG